MPDSKPRKTVRKTVLDTDAQQVGGKYARALIQAAESAGQTDAVLEELISFIDDVVDRSEDFEAVLSSAIIGSDEKEALLDRTLGGQASPLFMNFLKVVARHERLNAIRAIRVAAVDLYDEMRGRVKVEVQTATELDEASRQRLAGSLQQLLGGEPRMTNRVVPELIGGVVLRVGDTVYDGSVAAQLEKLRGQMIDRSVHEIQSRRDRFRDPG